MVELPIRCLGSGIIIKQAQSQQTSDHSEINFHKATAQLKLQCYFVEMPQDLKIR